MNKFTSFFENYLFFVYFRYFEDDLIYKDTDWKDEHGVLKQNDGKWAKKANLEHPEGPKDFYAFMTDPKWNTPDVLFYLNQRADRYKFYETLAMYSFYCCIVFAVTTAFVTDK